MPKHVIVWLDDPVTFEIIDGIAIGRAINGRRVYELRGRPSTLLATLRNGGMAYASFAGTTARDVLRFKAKKKRRH